MFVHGVCREIEVIAIEATHRSEKVIIHSSLMRLRILEARVGIIIEVEPRGVSAARQLYLWIDCILRIIIGIDLRAMDPSMKEEIFDRYASVILLIDEQLICPSSGVAHFEQHASTNVNARAVTSTDATQLVGVGSRMEISYDEASCLSSGDA
jgi:hypothetical protein